MHLPAAKVILCMAATSIWSALPRGIATEATTDEERAFMVDFKRRRIAHQQPTAMDQAPRNASTNNNNTIKRRRRELLEINVDDHGQKCRRNPLHERVVDPVEFKYGCKDIQVSYAHTLNDVQHFLHIDVSNIHIFFRCRWPSAEP